MLYRENYKAADEIIQIQGARNRGINYTELYSIILNYKNLDKKKINKLTDRSIFTIIRIILGYSVTKQEQSGKMVKIIKKQKTLTKTGKKRPNNPRKKSRHNTILIFLYCPKNGHNSFFVAVTVLEKKGDLV